MGCRQGRQLALTVALAFVDRFIPNDHAYFECKATLREALQHQIEGELCTLDGATGSGHDSLCR
jgi:S-adenosylmethionine synthetase